MSHTKYIEDITECEKKSRDYGDQPILVAGEKDEKDKYPDEKVKVGNQSKDYYKE